MFRHSALQSRLNFGSRNLAGMFTCSIGTLSLGLGLGFIFSRNALANIIISTFHIKYSSGTGLALFRSLDSSEIGK